MVQRNLSVFKVLFSFVPVGLFVKARSHTLRLNIPSPFSRISEVDFAVSLFVDGKLAPLDKLVSLV